MAEARVVVSAEQLGLTPGEEYEGELDFDLGNLMACDPSPQNAEALKNDTEAHCLETATRITQSLIGQLFKLPGRLAEMGRVVELPDPKFALPRQKQLPAPRPPTRWEKFAQQKGIQKRKRSVKVWDEDQQEWRRRYGYKRAGDENAIPILEAASDDKIGEDPFAKLARERKEKKKSGEKRELSNAKNALKKAGKKAVPSSLKIAASLPEHGKGLPTKRKELKNDIKQVSRHAGVATASMGKFDEKVRGERPGERIVGSKRRKFEPNVGNTSTEKQKAKATADKILRERADTVTDANLDFAVERASKRLKDDLSSGVEASKKGGKFKKGKDKFTKGSAKRTVKSAKSKSKPSGGRKSR